MSMYLLCCLAVQTTSCPSAGIPWHAALALLSFQRSPVCYAIYHFLRVSSPPREGRPRTEEVRFQRSRCNQHLSKLLSTCHVSLVYVAHHMTPQRAGTSRWSRGPSLRPSRSQTGGDMGPLKSLWIMRNFKVLVQFNVASAARASPTHVILDLSATQITHYNPNVTQTRTRRRLHRRHLSSDPSGNSHRTPIINSSPATTPAPQTSEAIGFSLFLGVFVKHLFLDVCSC